MSYSYFVLLLCSTFMSTPRNCVSSQNLVLLPVSATAQCTDALKQALNCIKGNHQSKMVITYGNFEKAVKDCRERHLHKSVDCLEEVLERCKNDKVNGEILLQYIDVDNTRKSVNYLCENLGALKLHRACIRNGHREIDECTKEGQLMQMKQLNKNSNKSHIDRICSFSKISLECYEKVLDSTCGEEANNFLYNVMTGPSPRICKQLNDNGTTRTQSYCLTVFMSLATVLLSFMLR